MTALRFETDGRAIHLVRDGRPTPLPALWLRERCRDARARDAISDQRLFNPHELPEDLGITDVAAQGDGFHVAFSDGFAAHFTLGELAAEVAPPASLPGIEPWMAADGAGMPFDWGLLQASEDHTLACLRQFLARGFVIVAGTPTERESILAVAGHFGHVRDTNFGRFFEVFSRPASNDLAYRAVPLAPHTDNPYRNPVPGVQLLHCLVNATSGGHSTLVDGISVCHRLRGEDPDGFRLLTEIPVGFRFRDPQAHLAGAHPLVETDRAGEPTGIHYSPRLDETPLLDEARLRAFHRARQRLGRLLADPEFELRFLLEPGQLMMFDNNRVLHGRTGYDPAEGMRHLQGCYIDRDGPESRFRVLSVRLATDAAAA